MIQVGKQLQDCMKPLYVCNVVEGRGASQVAISACHAMHGHHSARLTVCIQCIL